MATKSEIRKRPWCPGCGLWFAVYGKHRDICTREDTHAKRQADVGKQ